MKNFGCYPGNLCFIIVPLIFNKTVTHTQMVHVKCNVLIHTPQETKPTWPIVILNAIPINIFIQMVHVYQHALLHLLNIKILQMNGTVEALVLIPASFTIQTKRFVWFLVQMVMKRIFHCFINDACQSKFQKRLNRPLRSQARLGQPPKQSLKLQQLCLQEAQLVSLLQLLEKSLRISNISIFLIL